MTKAQGRAAMPLLLLLALGTAAGNAPSQPGIGPGGEVRLAPPALIRMARSMDGADPIERWDFADTLLDVLLEAYRNELLQSRSERLTDTGRAARLVRWQNATALVVDDLLAARRALGEGAMPTVQVDATGQLLLFVDRRPIVFSPPRPGTETALMDQALERYCARHDCAPFLADTAASEVYPTARGNWSLRQGAPPVYAIGDRLHCTFADLSRRAAKGASCEAAAIEVARLREALRVALVQRVAIDWAWVGVNPPHHGPDTVIWLQAQGRHLRLSLPLMARLSAADWQRVVAALAPDAHASRTVVIGEGERLLEGDDRG
jgi:hypothetical protein